MSFHVILGGLVQKRLDVDVCLGELFEKSSGDQEQRSRTEDFPEGRCSRASTGSWSMPSGTQRRKEFQFLPNQDFGLDQTLTKHAI